MLRIFEGDYPYYECSKCGKQVEEIDDRCPYCEHWFNEVTTVRNDNKFNPSFEEVEENSGTLCTVIGVQTIDKYIFANLKIDDTPHLYKLPLFQIDRLLRKSVHEFYVFKKDNFFFNIGDEIYLNMENFSLLKPTPVFSIYYDKTELDDKDIAILKTYNFEVR